MRAALLELLRSDPRLRTLAWLVEELGDGKPTAEEVASVAAIIAPRQQLRVAIELIGLCFDAAHVEPGLAVWDRPGRPLLLVMESGGRVVRIEGSDRVIYAALPDQSVDLALSVVGAGRSVYSNRAFPTWVAAVVPCDQGVVAVPSDERDHGFRLPGVKHDHNEESWRDAVVRAAGTVGVEVAPQHVQRLCTLAPRPFEETWTLVGLCPAVPRHEVRGTVVSQGSWLTDDGHIAFALARAHRAEVADERMGAFRLQDGTLWYFEHSEGIDDTTMARVVETAELWAAERCVVELGSSDPQAWIEALGRAAVRRVAVIGFDPEMPAEVGSIATCVTWDPTEALRFVRGGRVDLHPIVDRFLRDPEGAIAELDARICRQLDEILHHPVLTELDGRWRALHGLVQHGSVELLNASKEDLLYDFEDAPELSASGLSRLIRPEPPDAIVTCYDFGPGPQDASMLGNCAAAAAMSCSVFVAAASDILLEQTPHAIHMWQFESMTRAEDARHIVLTAPRILCRLPHHASVGGVHYREREDALPWASAAFAMAARMLASHARFGWAGRVEGPAVGGCVDGDTLFQPAFSTEEAADHAAHGFAAWESSMGAPMLRFAPTMYHRAVTQDHLASSSMGDLNAPFSEADVRLDNLMFLTHIARYVKRIHQEHCEPPLTAEQAEVLLQDWLDGLAFDATVAVDQPLGHCPWLRFCLRVRGLRLYGRLDQRPP